MNLLYESDRDFEVWSFSASHRQLILRSNPDRIARTATRVEIYFGHVEFMSIRSAYRGVAIAEADLEEASSVAEKLPSGLRGGGAYLIEGDLRSFVISARPAWREAECDFDSPSLFEFRT
ncbi:hypothetical protein OG349_17445 [Streptomyces sp. NBC_01317]|uniref:hypothetical protein n=1 Tax=Streptomyces sp. NBC_01317 TaxID=2903822 RepID=UPI002E0DE846|nr:hypothetical protein OG349_17445 [Streptomyces sp. NBC_01317]